MEFTGHFQSRLFSDAIVFSLLAIDRFRWLPANYDDWDCEWRLHVALLMETYAAIADQSAVCFKPLDSLRGDCNCEATARALFTDLFGDRDQTAGVSRPTSLMASMCSDGGAQGGK